MRWQHWLLAVVVCATSGCTAVPLDAYNPLPRSTSPTAMANVLATTVTDPEPTPDSTPTPTVGPTVTSSPTATQMPTPRPTRTPRPEAHYRRFILIDQDSQTMYVYENAEMIRRIPVSTGMPDQEETITPAWEGEVGRYVGTFFAFDVYADEAWYLFEHYGSMLIHSAPYTTENGIKVYQELDVLGVRPASHGCIRLPPEDSKWFSEWEPQGAHVIILPLPPAS